MVKIAGLIVTYNPNFGVLKRNIDSCINQVSRIVIVDNASNNIKEVEKLQREYGIDLLKLNKNIGIAGAQNKGFCFLKNKGYDWVLNLDQDSKIPSNLINSFENSNKLLKKTGIIAASYIDKNWSEKKKKEFRENKHSTNIEKKRIVISSGNLVNVNAWYDVDGFDESLFIDFVDFDFDTKLIIAGYDIYQINDVYIVHSIGSRITRGFLSKILLLPDIATTSDHGVVRQYYIYRNSMIFYKRYSDLYKKKFLVLRTIFATRRILLYKYKKEKFKSAFKGIIDGAKYSPNEDFKFQNIMKKIKKGG